MYYQCITKQNRQTWLRVTFRKFGLLAQKCEKSYEFIVTLGKGPAVLKKGYTRPFYCRIRTFTRNGAATRLQIRARVVVALLLLESAPAAAAASDAAASAAAHADQGQGLGPDELDAGDHLVAQPLEETLRMQAWDG